MDRLSAWPAKELYNELASKCFERNPDIRCTFSGVLTILEAKYMNEEELQNYAELAKCYYKNNFLINNNVYDTDKIQSNSDSLEQSIASNNLAYFLQPDDNVGNTVHTTAGYLPIPFSKKI